MSDPLCYIYYMIMSIYEVQTHDGDATLGWIQGYDDDHAQRVAGNQQSGSRKADAQIGADLQQQTHDDKFGNADAEGTDHESVERAGHE